MWSQQNTEALSFHLMEEEYRISVVCSVKELSKIAHWAKWTFGCNQHTVLHLFW